MRGAGGARQSTAEFPQGGPGSCAIRTRRGGNGDLHARCRTHNEKKKKGVCVKSRWAWGPQTSETDGRGLWALWDESWETSE